MAQLDHENIVRIFDVSELNWAPFGLRIPFLVMECLEGETLAAFLWRERPTLRCAVELLGGVAAGLAHAHEHHVIHRDLKPSNVFLTRQGKVKLLDFGLAHLAEVSGPPALPHLPMAGTPPYMAPEQWRGAPQDERTDLWAAGVLFFELLTGRPLYPSLLPEELRALILSSEPVPQARSLCPELPAEVDGLLATLLAKDPAKRLSSAEELREELRELGARLMLAHEVPPSAAPQRRQVTLVDCRLVGLATPDEPLDPEDSSELQAAFHRVCSQQLLQYGGFIELCLGNEVLACFGFPLAQEDDSERAVRAGLHLVQALPAALQEEAASLSRTDLALKVGIHTDLVVLDGDSPNRNRGALVIQGEAPRVAGWLARQAEPGTVLLGATTWRLVHGAFVAEELGPRTFEGMTGEQAMQVHRLLRERLLPIRFERGRGADALTPLVGRQRELRYLLELMERTRRGQGAVAFISGEAGIGKSRLIQEVCQSHRVGEGLLLRCQCWPHSGSSAFRPIIEMVSRMLRPVLEVAPAQRLHALEERLGLLGLSPEQVLLVANFLSLPGASARLSPLAQLDAEGMKERKKKTFEALQNLLRNTAARRPVILVVEDLHWADPSTLELLGFFLERLARDPVLLLLSARPEFLFPWPPRPWVHSLVVERLPAADTEALVREAAHNQALTEETVRQLVAKTDGVPLFA
ncbi:MAG TPA: AAA family ATPase, partial [Cystobacter sp.]